MVRLVTHDEDQYDRTIADIYLPVDDPLVELPNLFLNREPVKAGLAWHYKEYSHDKRLAGDENNAQSMKLGLWGGSLKPIAPWDWQKLSKVERDEFRQAASQSERKVGRTVRPRQTPHFLAAVYMN